MRVPTEVLEADMSPAEARERVRNSPWTAWPVVDSRGLVGMLDSEELTAAETKGANGVLAEVASVRAGPHLHDDHLLDLALERMGEAHASVLPVVSRLDVRRLEGVVGLQDVMRVYGFGKARDD
jgi:CIC family chloride channel protein